MNRSPASKTKAASKAAADSRSRASRANSQDKAASRVVTRSLGKAVNRLSAELSRVPLRGATGGGVGAHATCGLRPCPCASQWENPPRDVVHKLKDESNG
jgi:hypothetical protein